MVVRASLNAAPAVPEQGQRRLSHRCEYLKASMDELTLRQLGSCNWGLSIPNVLRERNQNGRALSRGAAVFAFGVRRAAVRRLDSHTRPVSYGRRIFGGFLCPLRSFFPAKAASRSAWAMRSR